MAPPQISNVTRSQINTQTPAPLMTMHTHCTTTPTNLNPLYTLARKALGIIANNTIEHWHQKSFYTVEVDAMELAGYTLYLIKHAMVCYFTNRCLLLSKFKDWVSKEIFCKRGWGVDQVKFVGLLPHFIL